MMHRHVIGVTLCAMATSVPLFAQSNPTYVQFAPGAVKGALYKPDSGPAPHVAVLLIHRTSNFLSHPATRELSKRGFMVLGVNPRSDNNEAAVNFEANALDIKAGIEFLRKQPGITKVVLLGHSGGGPATSFYQAVAEKGSSYCRGPAKLTECDQTLEDLPKADGLVLMDAHPAIRSTVCAVSTRRSSTSAIRKRSTPPSTRSIPRTGKRRCVALFPGVSEEILRGAGCPDEPADRPGHR